MSKLAPGQAARAMREGREACKAGSPRASPCENVKASTPWAKDSAWAKRFGELELDYLRAVRDAKPVRHKGRGGGARKPRRPRESHP